MLDIVSDAISGAGSINNVVTVLQDIVSWSLDNHASQTESLGTQLLNTVSGRLKESHDKVVCLVGAGVYLVLAGIL